MKKSEVLDKASEVVVGSRQDDYGDAGQNHARIAAIWSALLDHPVTPADVAKMMIGLKLSRLTVSPDHEDSWVDIAGYAAIGGELTTEPCNDGAAHAPNKKGPQHD